MIYISPILPNKIIGFGLSAASESILGLVREMNLSGVNSKPRLVLWLGKVLSIEAYYIEEIWENS